MARENFQSFYASDPGTFVKKVLVSCLKRPRLKEGSKVLGIGYSMPILDGVRARKKVVCLPDLTEVTITPDYTLIPFADDSALPLQKEQFDCVYALHSFEYATYPAHFLREAWRMLRPEGTLVVIVPQEASSWHLDKAHPLPRPRIYTPKDLSSIFKDSYLTITERRSLLFSTPRMAKDFPKLSYALERTLGVLPTYPGAQLSVIYAQKNVFMQTARNEAHMPQFSWAGCS